MDGRKFDGLVRLMGAGASRRQLIRGLLGLGGAVVLAEEADARTARSRPTIPPPPTTPPPATTTTTAAPCLAGQELCPNSTLCCHTGTCARSGNQAICCTGYVCGLECCGSEYECCDGECCAAGHTCLTSVFAEGPNVEEEMCCPAHLACDNQCCNGSCYSEYGGPVWYEDYGLVFNGHPVAIAGTHCCAAGGTVCDAGVDGYVCCGGNTPKCCSSDGETPGVCRAEGACCTDADCDTCERCTNGTCEPIPGGAICEGPESAICCFGETPGCCIRDGGPICLFGRACCDDSQCDAGECDVCDVSLGAASNCVSRDSVCEDLYGPGCTCSLGQCSCPTTTRDPNLCLEIDMTCDPATNRCCAGLGCQNPYGAEPYCDYCISDDETRCRHDSNCCPGLVCQFGTCRSPQCTTDEDCAPCGVCSEFHVCELAPFGTDPGGFCGNCSTCQLIVEEFESYVGCAPVTDGQADPLDRCPVEGAICCSGTCSGSAIETCNCTSDAECGPCLVCDEGSGVCMPDCRSGAAGECCQGSCHYCHPDNGLCHDDDSLCSGECKACRFGECVDNRFYCGSDCDVCINGQCIFSCFEGGGEYCCDRGSCGRAYCAPDGSCVVEPDPREVCDPCHECRLDVFGEYSCQAVENGSEDPQHACADGQVCCSGVCSANATCGSCMVHDDCGPCLACVAGTCFPDCTRRPADGSSCCFGCLECDRESGWCDEDSSKCPGCADCEGGICVSDDGDCDDCEVCVNGVCVFNCNNELGPIDCCENTGTCGTPLCGMDGQCAYAANPAACVNPCEECVDTGSGGPYNCLPKTTDCECVSNSDCGLCGVCDDNHACAFVPDGTEIDAPLVEGICCGGAFIEDGECCDVSQCGFGFGTICNPDTHECVECIVDTDCSAPTNPCFSVTCESALFCDEEPLEHGETIIVGGVSGVCCFSESAEFVFQPGECCDNFGCPGPDDFCCAGTCQSEPCSCVDDSSCTVCETCGASQLCEAMPDGTVPPNPGYGVCCSGEFFSGQCCSSADCCQPDGCATSEFSQCIGHQCVQCIADADCQFEPDNPCVIQGCTDEFSCYTISAPDGPVVGGQCCDGQLIAATGCCSNADCAGTPDTPFCHFALHMCTECDGFYGCPQCESCDDSIGSCRFDCNIHLGNPAACCPGVGNQCDSGPVGRCVCEPGLALCDPDPGDPESPLICAECCGTDASNCLNVNPAWDAECVACSGVETNVCVAANEDGLCTVDATGRQGFCNNHVCKPCQDGGIACNGNSFVCCSGVCDSNNLCTQVTGLVGSETTEECVPQTCDTLGCGPHEDDGCGKPVDCGECPAASTTSAPCVPRDVCDAGECGEVGDGCGGTIVCDDCPTTPAPCTPGTCESLGGLCGQSIDDGCGAMIYCGDCPTTTPPCTARGDDCSDASECCAGDTCRAGKCRRARG